MTAKRRGEFIDQATDPRQWRLYNSTSTPHLSLSLSSLITIIAVIMNCLLFSPGKKECENVEQDRKTLRA